MKTSLSLVELAQQIQDRAQRKQDFIIPSTKLRAELDEVDGRPAVMLSADDQVFRVNDHAHGQIAAHLEIPKAYYNRMRIEQPELLTANINTWLSERGNERRMVRTLDGTARAFLSDKFARLDDDAFAETTLPIIMGVEGAEIDSAGITDEHTYMKFTAKSLTREIKAGDVLQFGVMFRNSEVGAGALEAALFTKRLICTNGMVSSEDVFRSAHLGARHSGRDMTRIYQMDTVAADGRATILKLRDHTSNLLNDKVMDEHVRQLQMAASVEIKKPTDTIERLGKTHGLTEGERESVLAHLIRNGDLSAFGLAQAVTRTAEDVESYERATQLERVGGKLINLSRTDFRELAIAA